MTTKARIEADERRQRITDDSPFGIWTDTQQTIRVRISPSRHSVRVRIVEILDASVIDVIVFFCGLDTTPKRSKWTHFDLVTNLVRAPFSNSYHFGEVHLPRASRRTGASLVTIGKSMIQLNFLDNSNEQLEVCTGSIILCKSSVWHNRDDR